MREKLIEKKLREAVKNMGGLALKFLPYFWVGAPDRIVLLPGARVYWVETKSTGDDLKPRQRTRKKQLEKLGFKVYKVDTQEKLDQFIEEVKASVG
ncbi:VRR-NUC domain-containing protein [Clostridium sp. 'deep sea']|uniref:VRR-NUC domain-containing protein n=1 Tax=Clostridium sp. 'deep sea' TaxID=2779445 RepID=UPI00189683B6|nr:VRR-NUC domain-containing protein [Clostridium sp. 'deep sea']QOR34426.1 VRR-NUC domain-containing protein [Clostridium sp. 'deep sea']